ncbi:MAG: hypothetical protein ACD_67C00213G0003 [uncultured bacterium]|nr:MAG: hypothetical protein ACD_67C00213G0003 [uncultured bacterium]
MGIEIEITNQAPFFLYTTKEKEGEKIDVVLIHFLAKRIGEIKPGTDVREWKWIPISELENHELAPNIIPTLKHFNFIK